MERRAAVGRQTAATQNDEFTPLLKRITGPSDSQYPELVRLLENPFASLAASSPYFPVSQIREFCRRFLKSTPLGEESQLLFLRAAGDAMLSTMAGYSVGDTATLGSSLQLLVQRHDRNERREGLALRLRHLAGLRVEEFPSAALRADAPDLLRNLEPDLKSLGEKLNQQYLMPRGTVTALLEKARDGEQSLAPAIERHHPALSKMAKGIAYARGRGLSINADELLNEAVIRMFRCPEVPVNRSALKSLARKVMHGVLADRRRRNLPGAGSSKSELTEFADIAESLSRAVEEDDGPLADLLAAEKVTLVEIAIENIRRTLGSEQAEIVRSRLFAGLTLEQLAKIHDVSVRTVQRLMADFGAMCQELLEGRRRLA